MENVSGLSALRTWERSKEMRSIVSDVCNPISAASGASLLADAVLAADFLQPSYKTREVDGLRIFYREAGPADAPIILLLYGFPTSSHMYRDLIPRLAIRYHVIAPDYPGYGFSDAPSPATFAYTFDHLADVMDRFVQAVGAQRYVLYAQDF